MVETRIRDRRPHDLKACVATLLAVHTRDGYPTNWPKDPIRWLTPTNTLQAWVAITDSADVTGHLLVQAANAQNAQLASIARLFVAPESRGQGLGARLLAHAGQWAAAREIGLELEVTADERSSAIALYERTGWSRTGTSEATWTTPDGRPVLLHRYALRTPSVTEG